MKIWISEILSGSKICFCFSKRMKRKSYKLKAGQPLHESIRYWWRLWKWNHWRFSAEPSCTWDVPVSQKKFTQTLCDGNFASKFALSKFSILLSIASDFPMFFSTGEQRHWNFNCSYNFVWINISSSFQ